MDRPDLSEVIQTRPAGVPDNVPWRCPSRSGAGGLIVEALANARLFLATLPQGEDRDHENSSDWLYRSKLGISSRPADLGASAGHERAALGGGARTADGGGADGHGAR